MVNMAIDPIRVYCTECSSAPGERCQTKGGAKRTFHSVRQILANNATDDVPSEPERPTSHTYEMAHCDVEEQHVMHGWIWQHDEDSSNQQHYLCDGSAMDPVPTSDMDISSGPYAIGSQHWPGVAKMIEECGEVTQVLSKLIATNGNPQHWDGHEQDLFARISDELGDLTAAMIFLQKHNPDLAATQERVTMKLRWFDTWHREGRG